MVPNSGRPFILVEYLRSEEPRHFGRPGGGSRRTMYSASSEFVFNVLSDERRRLIIQVDEFTMDAERNGGIAKSSFYCFVPLPLSASSLPFFGCRMSPASPRARQIRK